MSRSINEFCTNISNVNTVFITGIRFHSSHSKLWEFSIPYLLKVQSIRYCSILVRTKCQEWLMVVLYRDIVIIVTSQLIYWACIVLLVLLVFQGVTTTRVFTLKTEVNLAKYTDWLPATTDLVHDQPSTSYTVNSRCSQY